jgi:hypothetical protein
MNEYSLTPAGVKLQSRLRGLNQKERALSHHDQRSAKVSVAGAGKTVSMAYEQLRNAAEYTEEHLLLQRAIRRFYTRNISFYDKKNAPEIADELIIELTQSGYLQNNTVAKNILKDIQKLITNYYNLYWQLREHRVSQDSASTWVLDILSVSTEASFHPLDNERTDIFAACAFDHYYEMLKKDFDGKIEFYDMALFTAIHRALLKSDQATVRVALLTREQTAGRTFKNFQAYLDFNELVDAIFSATSTDHLVRYINKYGAPLRILNRLIQDMPDDGALFGDRPAFLAAFDNQTRSEYKRVNRKINRGVIRSILFLFITKVIIGILIEIPYDLYFHNKIIWLPLIINLLFPPVFMASLRLSMKLPRQANSDALREYVDKMLYGRSGKESALYLKPKQIPTSGLLNAMYIAMFVFIFSIVALQLWLWQFSLIHIAIFFTFLSTASFLGFRLSRLIRELEMVNTNQGVVALVRDFAYTPFILVGRWISDKYSRVNVVALILDMAIELPLKTFLRLLRQWTQFLSDKRDEL